MDPVQFHKKQRTNFKIIFDSEGQKGTEMNFSPRRPTTLKISSIKSSNKGKIDGFSLVFIYSHEVQKLEQYTDHV